MKNVEGGGKRVKLTKAHGLCHKPDQPKDEAGSAKAEAGRLIAALIRRGGTLPHSWHRHLPGERPRVRHRSERWPPLWPSTSARLSESCLLGLRCSQPLASPCHVVGYLGCASVAVCCGGGRNRLDRRWPVPPGECRHRQ